MRRMSGARAFLRERGVHVQDVGRSVPRFEVTGVPGQCSYDDLIGFAEQMGWDG